jgi:hypothetical protein
VVQQVVLTFVQQVVLTFVQQALSFLKRLLNRSQQRCPEAALPVEKSVPKPRSPELPLTGPIPRHWFAGNALATHLVNGVSMLFPAGERFFVRSVNHYLGQLTDPLLRAQVKGFFAQEGRHAKEHDRWNEILVAQGFSVDHFLALYERLAYGVIERIVIPRRCGSRPLRPVNTTPRCLPKSVLRNRILDHCRSHDASTPFVARSRGDRAPCSGVRCPYKQFVQATRCGWPDW